MGLLARAQSDDRERGAEMLAGLEQQFPDDPELLWARAQLRLAKATPEADREAEQLLERVVQLRPTVVNAHLRLIQMAMARGDTATARTLAIRSLESNPDAPALLLARAEVEALLNNVATARTALQSILRDNPRDAAALHLLTQLALKTETPDMLEEAQRLLQDASQGGLDDARLPVDLAFVLSARGESDRAVATLEEFRTKAQQNDKVTALLALSELHERRGEPERTDACLREAAELAPDEPLVLQTRVEWLGKHKRLDDIIDLMRGDQPDPPYTAQVLFAAGLHLLSSDVAAHGQTGRELLETALTRLPPRSELQLDIAGALYQTGSVDRAEQIYREALASDPQNPRALNDLAWILAEARNAYEEALPLADRGLAIAPQDAHLLDTRGVILSNLPGRLADARRDFERCAALSEPGTAARAKALLQVGRTCMRLGDAAEARRCLQEAREIDNQQPDVFTPEERAEIAGLLEQGDAK
jgi:tetratricopeptide (TPR) repeat protein